MRAEPKFILSYAECSRLGAERNLNAVFINENMPQQERLIKLNKIAIQQMGVLPEVEKRKLIK